MVRSLHLAVLAIVLGATVCGATAASAHVYGFGHFGFHRVGIHVGGWGWGRGWGYRGVALREGYGCYVQRYLDADGDIIRQRVRY